MVEKGKIYFYKLPGTIPKPAHEWLTETLEKIGEVIRRKKNERKKKLSMFR